MESTRTAILLFSALERWESYSASLSEITQAMNRKSERQSRNLKSCSRHQKLRKALAPNSSKLTVTMVLVKVQTQVSITIRALEDLEAEPMPPQKTLMMIKKERQRKRLLPVRTPI